METPVLLFCYNRPELVGRQLELLSELRPRKLYVFMDGPKDDAVKEVQDVMLRTIEQFKQVLPIELTAQAKNIGIRDNVFLGINTVFETEERCIILEDDCLPSPDFFHFCEALLERYQNHEQVLSIGGFRGDGPDQDHSYFFSKYPNTWGWATWKRAWANLDISMTNWPGLKQDNWLKTILKDPLARQFWTYQFDECGKSIITWDYPYVFACWLNGGIHIRSKINLVENVGVGELATHNKVKHDLLNFRKAGEIKFPLKHPDSIVINEEDEERIEWVFHSGIWKRRMQLASEVIRSKRT